MIKYSIAFIALILFINANVFSQSSAKTAENGLVWYTNLQEVHELSAKSNKPIFAFFTGSDWCGWCKRLQANVFVKRDFFQIPVYASATGYFTWAVPRGYQPTRSDSLIWHQASQTLAKYRQLRYTKHQHRKLTVQKIISKMTKNINYE